MKVLLGICGSIAAYKSLELIRLLKQQGFVVRAVATPKALEFVTQLSIDTLSGQDNQVGIEHIENAYEADVMLVAPATANTIAKMAYGLADDLLSQAYLSFRGPVLVAPAMETGMWEHPATQANIQTLKQRGVKVIEPESGELASGRIGLGRLASLECIVESVWQALSPQDFAGKHVLLTAGPTVEELDPVRYLSNYSSGKMGMALTRALLGRGAQVSLIHGPLQVPIPKLPGLKAYPIKSARDMLAHALELAPKSDIAILCAAVADFRPVTRQNSKIKKADGMGLELLENPDILKTIGQQTKKPFLVGFAAETTDLERNAIEKCREKNCDLICANLISSDNPAFGMDSNKILLVNQNISLKLLEKQNKDAIANQILDVITQIGMS